MVAARGSWTGEARALRDAAGIHHFGRANWASVTEALAAADLEVEPPGQPYESDPIAIRPRQWAVWEGIAIALLERVADIDRRVPKNAMWRDEVVHDAAIGEWIGIGRRLGWKLAEDDVR